jgi:hypothetical protein
MLNCLDAASFGRGLAGNWEDGWLFYFEFSGAPFIVKSLTFF